MSDEFNAPVPSGGEIEESGGYVHPKDQALFDAVSSPASMGREIEEGGRVHPQDQAIFDAAAVAVPQGTQSGGNAALAQRFEGWVKEAELSPHQAQLIKRRYLEASNAFGGGMVELAPGLWANPGQFSKTKKEVDVELRRQLGPNCEAMMAQARAAVQRHGGQDLVNLLRATGLGNSPVVVKAFISISGARLQASAGPEKETAEAQLDNFIRDPEKLKILMDANHPQHGVVLKERDDLMKLAHPGGGEDIEIFR